MVQLATQQTTAVPMHRHIWQEALLLTEAVATKKNMLYKCSMLNALECCALFCVFRKLSPCCSVTHLSLPPSFSQKVL